MEKKPNAWPKSFVFLIFLFCISACKEQVPELRRLSESNEDTNFNFIDSDLSVSSPSASVTINGTCDARFKKLETSLDEGQTWQDFQQVYTHSSSFESCENNQFKIVLDPISDTIDFGESPDDRVKKIWIRGDLGFTKSKTIITTVSSGDFTPPAKPVVSAKSDFTVPELIIRSGGTESDFARFECRINSGTWYECQNNDTITDNSTALPIGEEVTLEVSALDTSGNRSEVDSTKVRRGVIGRGVYGSVYDIEVLDNGDILVAGDFDYYTPELTNHLTKLTSDGYVDTSFRVGAGPSLPLDKIHAQDDRLLLYYKNLVTQNYQGANLSNNTFSVSLDGTSPQNLFNEKPELTLEDGSLLTSSSSGLQLKSSVDDSENWQWNYPGTASQLVKAQEIEGASEVVTLTSGSNSDRSSRCLTRFPQNDPTALTHQICETTVNFEKFSSVQHDNASSVLDHSQAIGDETFVFNDFVIDPNDSEKIIIGSDFNLFGSTSAGVFTTNFSSSSCLFQYDWTSNTFSSYSSTISENYVRPPSSNYARCVNTITPTPFGFFIAGSNNGGVYGLKSSTDELFSVNPFDIGTFNPTHNANSVSISPHTILTTKNNLYLYENDNLSHYYQLKTENHPVQLNSITANNSNFFVTTSWHFFPQKNKKSSNLVLFDSKGNIKKTFSQYDSPIYQIEKQGDKLILFTNGNHGTSSYSQLIRLNGDLSVDSSFPYITTDGSFSGILVDSNNSLYIYGPFADFKISGVSQGGSQLVKLTPDDELDTNFSSNTIKSGTNTATFFKDLIIDESQAPSALYLTGHFDKIEETSDHLTDEIVKINAETGKSDTNFIGRGEHLSEAIISNNTIFVTWDDSRGRIYDSNTSRGFHIINKASGDYVGGPSIELSLGGCLNNLVVTDTHILCGKHKIPIDLDETKIEEITLINTAGSAMAKLNDNYIFGGTFDQFDTARRASLVLIDDAMNPLEDLFGDMR